MEPVPYRVRERVVENRDSATLFLDPVNGALRTPRPGEFMMMYAFGIGEIAVSVSGISPEPETTVAHTVRAVGAVSTALRDAAVGSLVGLRGPFGTGWGHEVATGRELVIVAGGVGLAPLRPVIVDVLACRHMYGQVTVIAGARSRDDFLFTPELRQWSSRGSIDVHLTVDIPVQGWPGEVGFVTEPLRRLPVRPERTTAYLCGPEPMMRASAEVLMGKGLRASDIRVSLERNMQCGIGWCGHCQLGPLLLCRDGPVVGYDVADPLLAVKEL
ncbi:oxidoreductase [Mycolicibacterium smegmatis]|nr:[NiFe] hydrogenase, gamma subunit, putative [Mycolicibacterium smegmatis MC2 155]TBM52065.1 oxidoreductase [Mycolicibacterium smegmatis]TBH50521.1 oxidoreductase [Mycolicibacterium smegmatis MC2 155]TBM53893.1 oxidoreductase [Mycolicibacterium smegmatis]TBM65434.1 oxidoreductase [Mycolicibacterium smegmatis]